MRRVLKGVLGCLAVGAVMAFGSALAQAGEPPAKAWGVSTQGETCEGACSGWPKICCDPDSD